METLILIVRLALAATFAVAAVGKLLDLQGSKAAMAAFGVPQRWANPAGVALPVAEATVALLLLIPGAAWWGALIGLALLLAFIGGILFNLAQGRTPDCHCFGQLHSRPIGWQTVARNGALALLAIFLVAQGQEGVAASRIALDALGGATWLWLLLAVLLIGAAAVQMWFMYNLVRQNGRLLLRIEALERHNGITPSAEIADEAGERQVGLPVGTPAPNFEAPDTRGIMRSLAQVRAAGKSTLLVFLDPTCGPCKTVLPEVVEWQKSAQQLKIAVISRSKGTFGEAADALETLLIQEAREISEQFGARATPSAVLIDEAGRVAAPLALGPDAIRDLVQSTMRGGLLAGGILQRHLQHNAATHRTNGAGVNGAGNHIPLTARPQRVQPQAGESAPDFKLPALEGGEIALSDLRGTATVLLFWNPGCGFCRRMLPQVRAWETQANPALTRLVLISSGAADSHHDHALRATILLDGAFATGRAYGIEGTPSAILVDANGRIASETIVGEPAILGLLEFADQSYGNQQPHPLST